ncbi:TPA: hypothetical protein ANIA_11382 [Aspergillus nidulans FGSC A4]|uniref:Uncharacterized protein n=1 Tax=Emericella nidulans (strain FGSC A4 / ATCC 38163 / CBS 112.46 / NRRL 194 / M139) TaxID=227321 RepID=C8VHY8_EMENI|nr:TPA: hypothetical protein ANIA_11382 [Aspergillus nidulans FGSC A4]
MPLIGVHVLHQWSHLSKVSNYN